MKLYRYFMPGKDIFAGISDLNLTSSCNLKEFRKLLPPNYNHQYIQQRIETERRLYDLFKAKGGMPHKTHPYYLTLGCCDDWFFGRKHFFGSLVFDLTEFDPNAISFTYGDSIPTFMEKYNDGKEYRKNVYTLKEIHYLIQKYGYPQQWNPMEEFGPENYIEVQVWDDHPIMAYRQCGYPESEGNAACVSLIASRMMQAKGLSDTDQRSFHECIEIARSHPWWNWFAFYIKRANPHAFQSNVIHGITHGYKCALLAFILAIYKDLSETDSRTLVLSALYHDIGRNYYDNGRSHGQIGADIVSQYIDSAECIHQDKLIHAIRFHDAPEMVVTCDILQALKDVDTLDYLRLGFGEYNPNYLRTEEAKKMILFSLELNIYTYLDADMILKLISGD